MSDYPHDVLSRPPIRVSDDTTAADVGPELRDRLEALMDLHGCEATLEGWRKLALELAMAHVPAFRVETPADRTGKSGLGGRPATMTTFGIRMEAAKELKAGVGVRETARRIAKRRGIPVGTVVSSLYRDAPAPDEMRRQTYVLTARIALEAAADEVFQK